MRRRNGKRCWWGGLLCGLLLTAASLTQQIGIQTSGAGKAGFLTALYIVIVPVLGVFVGRRPGALVWISVAIALAGAWCLSMNGDLSIAAGDCFLLLCSFFFSLHILVIDRISPRVNGIWLSCIQFFVAGVVSTAAAVLTEPIVFTDLLKAWGPLLYVGVLSSGVAYTLQILGQKNVQPTVASLIMSLESVFAALAGWAILHEALSSRELLGCCLVFTAVILAQLPSPKRKGKADLTE